MSINVSTSRVVTHNPDPLRVYGPCLYCGGPSQFRAPEGDFCSDEHVSFHRQSEVTVWRRAVAR